jgi:hypothetical protein
MQLGRYEIENYYVVINNQTESRQRIVYIGNNGEENFIERYYGDIREGYSQSNSFLRNLNYTDINTHIPGESIVIFDKSLPPKPLIYISLSSIQSIERDNDLCLIIVDPQVDPTYLDFLTKFDCDQAYSLLNYLLENPMVDLGTMAVDSTPPVIFFNEYFFGAEIAVEGSLLLNFGGPLSTEDGDIFRVDIEMSAYEGPFPITKDDIISGLIYDITDNRDGSITLESPDVYIYKDVMSINNEVEEMALVGTYMVRFNLHDLSQNDILSKTIIFSLA